MVPLVKLDDSGYRPLDPARIRLPPPQPPNERLLAAVELFYAPPSHERPRDPEGWERLGLYEWSREKSMAIQRKKDDIASGARAASPPASPERPSRENTPEPTVPEEAGPKRKRYRSRERTRSRSGSRSSTPDPTNRSPARARKNSERSLGSGSPETVMPSFLTRRSPSPPAAQAAVPAAVPQQMPGGQLSQGNKGHQMLQKMGWKGTGLGSQESGITEPISGGEVRDRADQYKGMGVEVDPFTAFRKQQAGGYYQRVKDYQDGCWTSNGRPHAGDGKQ
jgi:calcium homeostasis ER protein